LPFQLLLSVFFLHQLVKYFSLLLELLAFLLSFQFLQFLLRKQFSEFLLILVIPALAVIPHFQVKHRELAHLLMEDCIRVLPLASLPLAYILQHLQLACILLRFLLLRFVSPLVTHYFKLNQVGILHCYRCRHQTGFFGMAFPFCCVFVYIF
jgi:hypothetical protein